MKYYFILGVNPALSIAEILAKYKGNEYHLLNDNVLEINFLTDFDFEKEINFLGGVIKIVKNIDFCKQEKEILKKIIKSLPEKHEGKFKFGFSVYGQEKLNTKRLAMEVKKELKTRNISCRWVTSQESTLSSVVITQNKLDSNGIEFVLIKENNEIKIGKTVAVQNFKSLSFRDFSRPARDNESGMIPPKLAQIMLNLASCGDKNLTLLDPFCGSGTILMEASLMGIKNIYGTDLSSRAIKDSLENIDWLKNKFQKQLNNNSQINIWQQDVCSLSKTIKNKSIDIIVTEPYLGPQRGRIEFEITKKELDNLYSKTLVEFKKVLKNNGVIVMIWPFFRYLKDGFLKPSINDFKIIKPFPQNFNTDNLKITKRNTIIYGRSDQKIWREIVLLN